MTVNENSKPLLTVKGLKQYFKVSNTYTVHAVENVSFQIYPGETYGLVVFTVFQVFIFGKLVKKHAARIVGYEEEQQFFLKFFDIPAFIIMAVMMSGGIFLRYSGIAPEVFIAVFYTGLGASLTLAGVLFGHQYITVKTC